METCQHASSLFGPDNGGEQPLNHWFIWALAVLTCFSITGCQSHKAIVPVASGYAQVAHRSHALFGDSDARLSLEYRDSAGKTSLVWPALSGDGVLVRGELAIFVGDKGYADSDGKVTRPRLFAVQAPGLPLDLTDEVLWRWARANGKAFERARDNFTQVIPEAINDHVVLHLGVWSIELQLQNKDWPDQSDLVLGWPEIADMMRAVIARGVERKDLRWHTAYMGEKF